MLSAWHQSVNVVVPKSTAHGLGWTQAAVGKPPGRRSSGLIYPTRTAKLNNQSINVSGVQETIPDTILALLFDWSRLMYLVRVGKRRTCCSNPAVTQSESAFGRTCSLRGKPQLCIPVYDSPKPKRLLTEPHELVWRPTEVRKYCDGNASGHL